MTRALRRAVLVVYGYRLAAGLAVGYPVARTFGAFGASSLPDGDLALFAPRAFHLMETLRLGARPLAASLEAGLLASVVFGVGAVLPWSFALAGLSAPEAPAKDAGALAVGRLSSLLFISGLGLLSKALLVVLAALATGAASAATSSLVNERTQDLVPLVVLVLGLLLVTALGLTVDLAFVVAIRQGKTGLSALADGAALLRGRPSPVLSAFARNVLGAVGLVAVFAALTQTLDVSRPGAARVAAVFLGHQIAVFGIAVLRVRFFARVLGLVPPRAADMELTDDPRQTAAVSD